jgi:hypothetical protein
MRAFLKVLMVTFAAIGIPMAIMAFVLQFEQKLFGVLWVQGQMVFPALGFCTLSFLSFCALVLRED